MNAVRSMLGPVLAGVFTGVLAFGGDARAQDLAIYGGLSGAYELP